MKRVNLRARPIEDEKIIVRFFNLDLRFRFIFVASSNLDKTIDQKRLRRSIICDISFLRYPFCYFFKTHFNILFKKLL